MHKSLKARCAHERIHSSTPDLLGLVNREITPDVIHRTALQLGEDDDQLRSALSTSVPSVLTALSDVASSETGATHLTRMIRGIDANRAGRDSVASILGSATGREQGTTLFDGETGERAPKIAEAVARASGIKAESAHKLLGGATGAALLTIGRSAQRLEPEGLRSMLGEQRGEFVRRFPAPVASLFDGGRAASRGRGPGPSSNVAETSAPRGTPAIRPVEGTGAPRLAGAGHPPGRARADRHPAPPGPAAARRPGGPGLDGARRGAGADDGPAQAPRRPDADRSARFTRLAAGGIPGRGRPAPARFTLSPLNFAFASTDLTPESMGTLDQVAAILRAYPSATIRVESYTDNVGTAAANLDLSRDRSETVKGLLGGKGIDPTRVATAGLGQENPIASNETDTGRALNRRTDIVVTGR